MWKPPCETCRPRTAGGTVLPSPCRRNANSTAAMHSSSVSKARTSTEERKRTLPVLMREVLPTKIAGLADHSDWYLMEVQLALAPVGRFEQIGPPSGSLLR